DADIYVAYEALRDAYFRSAIVDVVGLQATIEQLIARDSTWAHPYALLLDTLGTFTPTAVATRARAQMIASRRRDPVGYSMFVQRGRDQRADEQSLRDLDREFAASRDDMLLGWYLFEVLLELHRSVEALAVLRTMHEEHPELQFGADLEQSLTFVGS